MAGIETGLIIFGLGIAFGSGRVTQMIMSKQYVAKSVCDVLHKSIDTRLSLMQGDLVYLREKFDDKEKLK